MARGNLGGCTPVARSTKIDGNETHIFSPIISCQLFLVINALPEDSTDDLPTLHRDFARQCWNGRFRRCQKMPFETKVLLQTLSERAWKLLVGGSEVNSETISESQCW